MCYCPLVRPLPLSCMLYVRLNWLIVFISDSATDIIAYHLDRINDHDVLACRFMASGLFKKRLLNSDADIRVLRLAVYRHLCALFNICRKLPKEDQEIVLANFEQTIIDKDGYNENITRNQTVL